MTTTVNVQLEVRDTIAYVSLNRPDKHNGLDEDMMISLIRTARCIKKDKSIRCVILQDNGPSFCAGLDFGYVAKHPFMTRGSFTRFLS